MSKTCRSVEGFEFKVRDGGKTRWVRIQGRGGLLGDGTLAGIADRQRHGNPTHIGEIKRKLLTQARKQYQQDGDVLVLRDENAPPAKRFAATTPDAIVAIRERCWPPRR